eukprot:CAMPEP_0172820384 /NCGR_PEP_ID=MMETSP1075-20121228/15231_1 /TAXON_ID=2916 /ORGANISM="Ceratium fusus, Strain PA161109" /LENGTH=173 /DNA_ID=CAMNT_0013661045 /DNA_START=57 /DNA_END=578 /DNA_ORIENTATION=-
MPIALLNSALVTTPSWFWSIAWKAALATDWTSPGCWFAKKVPVVDVVYVFACIGAMTVAVVTGGAVTAVTCGTVAAATGGAATQGLGATCICGTSGADMNCCTLWGAAYAVLSAGAATGELTTGAGAAGQETEEPTYFTAGATSTLLPGITETLQPCGCMEMLPPPMGAAGAA